MEAQQAKIAKKEKRLELERQIMVNSLVPDKSTIHVQTEDPPRLMAQSRVLSLEIEPPEVVLPSIKPPMVYMHDDQKQRFISKLYSDPEKSIKTKIPLKNGMTFKQQLEKEEADKKEYEKQQLRW